VTDGDRPAGRATSKTARAKARRERHNERHLQPKAGCRSCTIRAAWRAGKFDHRQRRHPPRPDAWDPETEGQRLAELVGRHAPQEIADLLNRESHQLDGILRTETAVVVQIKRRGMSRWMVGYRLLEVERIFHFDHRAMRRNWLQPNLLVPTRTFSGRGTARDNFVFTDDDLLRFVREYPWSYDYRRFRAAKVLPGHLRAIATRLRAEAETAWRRDPYLTRDEFTLTMGWASKQPWQYWAKTRQLVPHRLRFHVWPATLGCPIPASLWCERVICR
jgi:hypothetical protein